MQFFLYNINNINADTECFMPDAYPVAFLFYYSKINRKWLSFAPTFHVCVKDWYATKQRPQTLATQISHCIHVNIDHS